MLTYIEILQIYFFDNNNTGETIVQQVHYINIARHSDTRMLEHTTDYSTDVIKMTVWAYSASQGNNHNLEV